MDSSVNTYIDGMRNESGMLPVWPPTVRIECGTIGILERDSFLAERKLFVPRGHVRDHGLDIGQTEPYASNATSFTYKSDDETDVVFALSGEAKFPNGIPKTVPLPSAACHVKFGGKSSVVSVFDQVAGIRVANVDRLQAQVFDLWDRYLWDPKWVVVTHLLTAARGTVLCSHSENATVELSASGAVPAAAPALLSLAANFTVSSSHGGGYELTGATDLTPFFLGLRLGRIWGREHVVREVEDRSPASVGAATPAPTRSLESLTIAAFDD